VENNVNTKGLRAASALSFAEIIDAMDCLESTQLTRPPELAV
jgi:hypothetical protein